MELRNDFSINLNFLLFLRNLSRAGQEEDIFPWLPLPEGAFLPADALEARTKALWEHILAVQPPDEDEDESAWSENRYGFSSLFRSPKLAANVTRVFSAWYRQNWKPLTELASIPLVGEYWDLLTAGVPSGKATVFSPVLSLVFTDPPEGWANRNKGRLVLSFASAVIRRKEAAALLRGMIFGEEPAGPHSSPPCIFFNARL